MKCMKFKDGGYIPLVWNGTKEVYYVKGHIDFEEAKEIIKEAEGIDCNEFETIHSYARWSCESDNEIGIVLRDYSKSGRGRFKVTKCTVPQRR